MRTTTRPHALARLLLWLVSFLPANKSVTLANIFVHEDAPNPPANIIVGAYYYPWHKAHFQISREGYIRKFLEPRQEIRLGEYDDTQPEVISQHLEWSKQANIDVWITSWWGPTSREDTTIREVILPHPGLAEKNHKIALLYETTSRIKKSEGWDTHRLAGDMEYICTTRDYMNHPNYFTIQGRPVLVVYLTRRLELEGKLPEVIATIRNACPNVYILGDQVWGEAPGEALDDLDAITNYDIYGNMGKPSYAGQARVDDYFRKSADWKTHANEHNAAYVPGVSPGYNDRGVRFASNNPGLSRRLTASSPEGSLFAAQLAQATQQLDPGADYFMLVNSFNEWHEDTQIEPVDGKATTLPTNLTQGLEYVGYGTLYLDLLHAYTSTNSLVLRNELAIDFNGEPYANDIHLAAFYYSWFTEEDFGAGFRAQLDPSQYLLPRFPDQIQQDLQYSWQSNIRVWVTPWSRAGHISDIGASTIFADTTLIESGHQIALFYYIHHRVVSDGNGGWDMSYVETDIHHLCQTYFTRDSYYKTSSSRPVLFLGLTRILYSRGSLEQAVAAIRNIAVSTYGIDIYLVGDQIWNNAPTSSGYGPFQSLDAVMNQDVYGNMGEPAGYAGQGTVDDYYEQQRKWRIAAWQEGCSFIPTVLPGFNDRAVRLGNNNPALSRKLTATADDGSFFAASLDKAKHLLDDEINDLMFINSFNHFQEDTQIYPVYGDATDLPNDITQGLTYIGYGETYLDLLTERFGVYVPPDPTSMPSATPSASPSTVPSKLPSKSPTSAPSAMPSLSPSAVPSQFPSRSPSNTPSKVHSGSPSAVPSMLPSGSPSAIPSKFPSETPSGRPSSAPLQTRMECADDPDWASSEASPRSCEDINQRIYIGLNDLAKECQVSGTAGVNAFDACPATCKECGTLDELDEPSGAPSITPSAVPSKRPSALPSRSPSASPSREHSMEPSTSPSKMPSRNPSSVPSSLPSRSPSASPSTEHSTEPSTSPSDIPTGTPSSVPSSFPSRQPSSSPSREPSSSPSKGPTRGPSSVPSASPSQVPSLFPSSPPSTSGGAEPSCDDDPNWSSDEKKSKDCKNVAKKIAKKSSSFESYCGKTDEDGVTAYEACPSTCDLNCLTTNS